MRLDSELHSGFDLRLLNLRLLNLGLLKLVRLKLVRLELVLLELGLLSLWLGLLPVCAWVCVSLHGRKLRRLVHIHRMRL